MSITTERASPDRGGALRVKKVAAASEDGVKECVILHDGRKLC